MSILSSCLSISYSFCHYLKGQSNEILDPNFFFIIRTSMGSLTNRLKYFRFWLRFRRDICILVSKKLTPRGTYETPGSQKKI